MEVRCAVCDGERFAPVHPSTVRGDDPPEAWYGSSRTRAGHFAIVRCVDCGLVMSRERDDDATLAAVYAALEDRAYDDEDANRARTADAHLGYVARYLPGPARVVDIGCATGAFVRAAAAAGWDATGVDASAWSIARAAERCPEATFVAGLLQDVHLPEGSFDAVTLWDTLEHVPDPAAALARARALLRPGGMLFLNLPNAASGSARLLGPRWALLLREHLWYFSPDTLGKLLDRVGFDLVDARANWVRFSAANVAGRLGQYPGPAGRLARRLAAFPALRGVPLRFPIGEMTVAARSRGTAG